VGTEPEVATQAAQRFEEWVAPHLRPLTAVAVRFVGRADAPDAVQDTLLRAWRSWESYSPEKGQPRAWLFAILLNEVRRGWRHRMLHRHDSAQAAVDMATREPEDSGLDVDAAVRRLPRRQQQAVVLYYFADLSVAEVGSVLGLSAGTVKAHLAAARARLRELLEES
jgi:RNA polymerase sigma-70 factor, ECF subfamily